MRCMKEESAIGVTCKTQQYGAVKYNNIVLQKKNA